MFLWNDQEMPHYVRDMGAAPIEQVPPDRFVDPRELVRMGLAKNLDTLRRWRKQGKGPHWIDVEGKVRYRLSDVLAYLDSRPGGGRIIAKPVSLADSVQQKD